MLRGTPEHPKTVALIRALTLPKPHVVGLLELLWHFTATYTPEGDIGRWSDAAIEGACGWTGEPGALVAAFVECGWLDESDKHRLVVHDWHEHSDRYVRRRLARHGRTMVTQRATKGRPKGDRQAAPPVPLPVPEPEPEPEPETPYPPDERAPEGSPGDETPERLDPGGFLDAVKIRLSGVIPADSHATWIRGLEARGWEGDTFVVEAPSEEHRAWVKRVYAGRLKDACHELGQDCRIRIVVRAREPATVHDGAL